MISRDVWVAKGWRTVQVPQRYVHVRSERASLARDVEFKARSITYLVFTATPSQEKPVFIFQRVILFMWDPERGSHQREKESSVSDTWMDENFVHSNYLFISRTLL